MEDQRIKVYIPKGLLQQNSVLLDWAERELVAGMSAGILVLGNGDAIGDDISWRGSEVGSHVDY